jgi:hypothetical protein
MTPKQLCVSTAMLFGAWLLAGVGLTRCGEIDMRPHWDAESPLENPHKGWYHHFPDNHLTNRYPIADDADLLEFPGMDHLYIRLAWAYLEPKEGQFDWPVIDQFIDKWTSKGLGISLRISCRETSTDRIEQQYATPRWVMEAGAKGDYYLKGEMTGPTGPWEPVFDDPVFLEKLERFLQALGARCDGKPWLRYVDIGSIGDWGEGHTSSGSKLHYGFEPRKVHVDLYRKYFPKTQLIISDDFVYSIQDLGEREAMHRYVIDKGIGYRDDSILVNWYITTYSDTDTVRSPQYFLDSYLKTPVVLELQHYGAIKRNGNWTGRPGSSVAKYGKGRRGPDYFRDALARLRATYVGYHGFAHEWLAENPELTVELLNRCGYWYYLHRVILPESWRAGSTATVQAEWENRGVAPAYFDYPLVVRLEGPTTVDLSVESGNRKWMPSGAGTTSREKYQIALPETLPAGEYALRLKLHSPQTQRDVQLALDRALLDKDGFYRIAAITVND